MTRHVSLDISTADLDEPGALSQIVVDHALAPCRRMWGLPEPAAGDDDHIRSLRGQPDFSPDHLDPVLRGLAVYEFLWPWGIHLAPGTIAARPAAHFVDTSFDVARQGTDRLTAFIAGLYGEPPTDRQLNWAMVEPWPNPTALAELRRARSLVHDALSGPEDWDMTVGLDTGLTKMRWEAWNEIDRILRSDVHRRLVWIGSVEPILPDEMPDGEGRLFAQDGGVYPTDVPETIVGLVALDLVDMLAATDRQPGLCPACGRAMLMSRADAARSRAGERVVHEDCARRAEVAEILARQGRPQ